MSIRNHLVSEIEDELKELEKIQVGSEQHKNAVDSVTRLVDRVIEFDKQAYESETKDKTIENDRNFKEEQLKIDKRDKIVKNLITIGGSVLTGAALVTATVFSIWFEKDYNWTNEGGRNAIRELLHFKFFKS